MKTAVLFDLDGTLWDATETIASAWNGYAESRGSDRRFTRDECRSYCGKTLTEIAAEVFPDADTAWREAFLMGCCAAENAPLTKHGGVLYPQLKQVLGELRKSCFLAVISNCQLGYIEAFFAGNQTGDLFDDYENAARTGLTKGENICLVMARNGIERAVYVGDTEGDRRAAEEAGVPFIHAAYGFGRVTRCDAEISSISQLPEAANRFLRSDTLI